MAQNNTLPLWYKTLHKRICYDYFPFSTPTARKINLPVYKMEAPTEMHIDSAPRARYLNDARCVSKTRRVPTQENNVPFLATLTPLGSTKANAFPLLLSLSSHGWIGRRGCVCLENCAFALSLLAGLRLRDEHTANGLIEHLLQAVLCAG
jgi:hypothetical protein